MGFPNGQPFAGHRRSRAAAKLSAQVDASSKSDSQRASRDSRSFRAARCSATGRRSSSRRRAGAPARRHAPRCAATSRSTSSKARGPAGGRGSAIRPRRPALRLRWRRARLGVVAAEVLRPAARIGDEGAVLDREPPPGDGVDQRPVVRDQQKGAGERLERSLERLAALDVEVVRRLVEHEEVRAARDDERERQPAPLAARERGHRLLVCVPPEKRNRPSSVCASARRSPVAACVASSTEPRSSSSTSCCEK